MSGEDSRDGDAPPSGRSASSYSKRPLRPQYMTVGSGSTSASAAALMASLDNDSGYGGSIADEAYANDGNPSSSSLWRHLTTHDVPTPPFNASPSVEGGQASSVSESDRRSLASHVHQLLYNQNRVALGRAITQTIDVLNELRRTNSEWPAHYPSVQEQDTQGPKHGQRPNLSHSQSMMVSSSKKPKDCVPVFRPSPRRAATSLEEEPVAGPSNAVQRNEDAQAETLITPQAAQNFSILKLDLKLQGLSQAEIAHSMDRRAISSLLEGRIGQSIRHLLSLRERIEDTSSKVLVTGDLNAGKSTFCNALLRRKLLPEDDQPCTSLFCEVLDARANGGLEEVHAVHKDRVYDRHDESTYDVYSLEQLEKIVSSNEQYIQCKIYVKDTRPIDQSLLNNGVVDIALIDAPGLNSDSLKTTELFARQEEIDVVVFVVSASNHFTLSAREFILQAAHEKAYIFMVVNGFDNVRDKQRCQKLVLEQVAGLSPRTFKESSELVHFVSSNAIPLPPAPNTWHGGNPGGGAGGGGGGGSSSSSSGSGPSGDPSYDNDGEDLGKHGEPGSPPKKGKGKEKENLEDFNHLEASLRRFVLEKRARSKLAPAKTYLMNMLADLNTLAVLNRDIAQSELDRVSKELTEIEPAFEESKRARSEVSEDIEKTIDSTCTAIYQHTRDSIRSAIAQVGKEDLGVDYPGLFDAFQYAEDIKSAILDQVSATVAVCEDDARLKAIEGVGVIKALGARHLGDDYEELNFRSDILFRKRRDALARQIEVRVEVWDFFDINWLWERQEKVAGTGMAMTVVGVLGGRMFGGMGWVDSAVGVARIVGGRNLRSMIVPGLVGTVCLTAAYVLHSIPYSLPSRLSRRIASTLATLDYTHINSDRIAREVGKVLRYPADNLRVGLQHSFEALAAKREDTARTKRESEGARKYFRNLVQQCGEIRRNVDGIDLEGPAPGVAAAYEAGPML